MSEPIRPTATDYSRSVAARKVRLCEWLGLDPELLVDIDDTDPDALGFVRVTWDGIVPVTPTHGTVIERTIRPLDAITDDTRHLHTGTTLLAHHEAEAMLRIVGPKPELFSPAQKAQLDAMRTNGGEA